MEQYGQELWEEFSFLGEKAEGDGAMAGSLFTWCREHGERGALLLEEWNREKNLDFWGEPIDRGTINALEHKKYWWNCRECGNEFEMSTVQRICGNQGCPICGHKRGGKINRANAAKNNSLYDWCMKNGEYGKRILEEWDTGRNREDFGYDIKGVAAGSGDKVHWICKDCGREYDAKITHRTIVHSGCPLCSRQGTSFPEQFIYYCLGQIFPNIQHRGKLFEGLEYDIILPDEKFCIEYSGTYWHKEKQGRDQLKRDRCVENGYRLLQIVEGEGGEQIEFSKNIISYKASSTKHLQQLGEIVKYIVRLLERDFEWINIEKAADEAYRAFSRPTDNNIVDLYPELMDEWDFENNNGLKPGSFTCGSHQTIHWKCKKCKFSWEVSLHSRIRFKTGCPHCGFNIFDGKMHPAKNRGNRIMVIPGTLL